MGVPVKSLLQSNTTKAVFYGAVPGYMTGEAIMAAVRANAAAVCFWPAGYDWIPAGIITVILIPLMSRVAANLRGRRLGQYLPLVALVAALAMAASGCMTGMPAVAGKTKVETVFVDRVDAQTDPVTGQITSPGQNTEYRQKAEVPAGVDIKGVASMSYDWGKDGDGHIAIAQDGSANTVEQAKMIPLVVQLQAENTRAMMEGFVNALAPILGTYVGNLGQIDLYNAQNPKTDPIKEAIAQALSQALQPQASSESATGLRELIRQLIEAELDRKTAPADSASK